jgi:hypothetical protein
MTKETLEKEEYLLLIENIPSLTKLVHKILSGMECFQSVAFIEYILILMISMKTLCCFKKMAKTLHT